MKVKDVFVGFKLASLSDGFHFAFLFAILLLPKDDICNEYYKFMIDVLLPMHSIACITGIVGHLLK